VRDVQQNRDNPDWMDRARKTHVEAETAIRNLIDANFSWSVVGRPLARLKKAIRPPES
jgi:hypothetical protein